MSQAKCHGAKHAVRVPRLYKVAAGILEEHGTGVNERTQDTFFSALSLISNFS